MELERIALPPPELPLALLELGGSGRFELRVGAPPGGGGATLPWGVPPFVPPPREELERLLLGSPEWLPPHHHERAPRAWQRSPSPQRLFALDPTPVGGGLRAQRDPKTGRIWGFTEELLPAVGLSPRTRCPCAAPRPPRAEPAGLRHRLPLLPRRSWRSRPPPQPHDPPGGEDDVDFDTDLLTTPPGMKCGVQFQPPVRGGPVSLSTLIQSLDAFDLGGAPEIPPHIGGVPDAPPPAPGGGSAGAPPPASPPPSPSPVEPEQPQGTEGTPEGEGEPWAVVIDTTTPVPDFETLVPDPAIKWPFRPDPFQQRAVLSLERGHSVLVAAHTSAGKTAVAEYGIALGRRHLTRTIYTSPIKALSNQKFREFRETFGDVGLVTGDVTLRPEAACLVMTTEILRSMLYNGSDVIRELEWVIFDEVHYINDEERGVVWEEALILLPPHVKLILLSATIPNALEFAQWVGRTKRRRIRVISTARRPVPLEHFLFLGGGAGAEDTPTGPEDTPTGPKDTPPGMFLLMDRWGTFHTQGYYAAVAAQKAQSSKQGLSCGARTHNPGGNIAQARSVCLSLLRVLRARGLLPAVVFSFSRGGCTALAQGLRGPSLVTPDERRRIHGLLHRWLQRLRGGDRELPQVLWVSELLERGLGVHHGGLLPLLKEVVELLFSMGLIKVLFATETFAMGVNMPARTVVFESLRKHDGSGFRDLLPAEYIQMSGRAGRRGLDATGTVIVLSRGPLPELSDLHRVLMGRPAPLQSRFRVTYSMLLNLLRVTGTSPMSPTRLMRRSFAEEPARRDTEAQSRRAAELRVTLGTMGDPEEPGGAMADLPRYHQTVGTLRATRGQLHRRVAESPGGLRVLAPGRVVIVSTPRHRNAPGVIVQVSPGPPGPTFTVLVLSERRPEGGAQEPPNVPDVPDVPDVPYPEDLRLTRLFLPEGPCGPALEQLQPEDFGGVTTRTLRVDPQALLRELRPPRGGAHRSPPPAPLVASVLQELQRLAGGGGAGGVALLPPPLRDPDSVTLAAAARDLEAALGAFECVRSPRFPQQYSQFARRQRLREELEQLEFRLSDQSLSLLPQYRQRMEVLRSLGLVSPQGSLSLGGRVAALLSPPEPLLAELLLQNALGPLRPEESAALLAATLGGPRGDPPPRLPRALLQAVSQLRAIAQRLGRLQEAAGLPEGPEELESQLGCGLVEAAYEWARGMPFSEVARLTEAEEGTLVRCLQRLDERLRQLRGAARILGDPALAAKLETATALTRRDVVVTASLYTQ